MREIQIPVRSGIINALLELAVMLFILPVVTYAFIKLINLWTFSNAKSKGSPVHVGRGIPSLSNPFALIKTRAVGNKLLLLGEIAIAASIFWIELGINGKSRPVYRETSRYILNSGDFPTVKPVSIAKDGLFKIQGLHAAPRSCFKQLGNYSYEVYALGFEAPRNFNSTDYTGADALCLSEENVKSPIGIRITYSLEIEPRMTPIKPRKLSKGIANRTCEEYIQMNNSFSVLGYPKYGGRFMVTAIETKAEIELVSGFLFPSQQDANANSYCEIFPQSVLVEPLFHYKIYVNNTKIDFKNLARATVVSYLSQQDVDAFRFDKFELLSKLYFSTPEDVRKDGKILKIGDFSKANIQLKESEQEVTTVTKSSLILCVTVFVLVFIGMVVIIFTDNEGRDINSLPWTTGVVQSNYEDLEKTWTNTPTTFAYWFQLREDKGPYLGPKGNGKAAER